MSVTSVLFIPDRFKDYRMWHDIPDRLQGHAEVIHLDQHEPVPWTADSTQFVAAVRRLASGGSFSIVAAAGQAAGLAVALAEAGVARGLVFFQPVLDSIPDDLDLSSLDLADLDPHDWLDPFAPMVDAVSEPDPVRRRDILVQIIRDTAGPGRDPEQLELEIAMTADHAEEFFAHLQAATRAAADGHEWPRPPRLGRPWIDRLADLAVPVVAVGTGPFVGAVAGRARNAEIVVAAGNGGMAPASDRTLAAEALLRTVDRVS